MGTQQRFAILDGWVARGFRFDIQPITAEQLGRIAQSFGPARFAYNWALGQVKADLDARTTDPAVPLLAWDFYELRRAWNQAKDQAAPWWRCLDLPGRQGGPPRRPASGIPPLQGPPPRPWPGPLLYRREAS